MNWQSISFDWNHVRAFLATAKEGSFSAAARALGLTQPTLGRQIAAFESYLGLVLFERHGRQVVLTAEGRELLEHVEAMGDAAFRLSLAASGQSQTIAGSVSITASDIMAAYLLPPILDQIRDAAPGIEIELVVSNSIANIQQREADIAIRHLRPDQPDLIGKLVRHATAHLYASKSYIERHGNPASGEDLTGHLLIGFDRTGVYEERLNQSGIMAKASNLQIVTQNGVAAWAMAEQGLGMCMMMDDVAQKNPDMVQMLPEIPQVTFPIWLTTHEELHSSKRIRLVFDHLAEGLKA